MSSKSSSAGGILAVLAVGLCCGVPALVASGALGVIGGVIARAWPLVLLGAGVLGYGIYRWSRRVRRARSRVGRP